MGVRIIAKTPRGKEVNLTPGARSDFRDLLHENGLEGYLDADDFGSIDAVIGKRPEFDPYLADLRRLISAHRFVTVEFLR